MLLSFTLSNPTCSTLVNIVKYELPFYSLETYLNATVDAITHVYCYVEYSVLTMQLPQHGTCKTKHHFPYTIVPDPHERKQFHESAFIHMKAICFQPRIPS